jgi:ABC-type glycerol-3-phosphate transport system permease component
MLGQPSSMLIPPVLLFFFAQKLFIQGVVVSGIKG